MRAVSIAFLCCLSSAFAWSCGGAVKAPPATAPAADAPPNGVHNRELRKIMRRMQSLTFSRMPQELGDDAGRRLSAERASLIASQLAAAADEIVMAAPQLKLSDSEQADFIAEAEALRARAGALRQRAASGEVPATDPALAAVKTSCTHCHERFRDDR